MPRLDPRTLTRAPAWHSRLSDHEEEIRQLRKKRWSYREIAAHLCAVRGVPISHNGVYSFVKARTRWKLYELPDPATPTPDAAPAFEPITMSKPPPPNAAGSPLLPRRGMLPPMHGRHRDSRGQPVAPPPDPNKFRAEHL